VERMVARSRRVSQSLSFHGVSAVAVTATAGFCTKYTSDEKSIVKDTMVKTWIINTVNLPAYPDIYRDERIIAHVHDLPIPPSALHIAYSKESNVPPL
jgi:hypothetical protein